MQLIIAVALLFMTNLFGLLQVPMHLELEKCKGLLPMVAVNVLGLKCVSYHRVSTLYN